MLSGGLILLLVSSLAQTPGPQRPLRLTLRRAVEIGTEDSARVRIARELAEQADSRVGEARAALLPNVDGQVNYSNQTQNLEALGIGTNLAASGINIPTFVGPFHVFDARASGTQ